MVTTSINKFLRSYWLKDPPWGIRRILFFLLTLFLIAFLAYATHEHFFLIIVLSLTVAFILFIIIRIYQFGFYHRLARLKMSNQDTEIYDFIIPGKPLDSKRAWRFTQEDATLSSAFLNKKINKKKSCYLDIVNIIYDKTINSKRKTNNLHLGGGGFAIPLFCACKYPFSQNEVVEIDRDTIEIAKNYFFPLYGKENYSNIKIINNDAYKFLTKSKRKYNFIIQDIFVKTKVPRKFLRRNWFKELKKHLKKEGLILINIGGCDKKENFRITYQLFKELDKVLYPILLQFGKNYIFLLSFDRIKQSNKILEGIKKYILL